MTVYDLNFYDLDVACVLNLYSLNLSEKNWNRANDL